MKKGSLKEIINFLNGHGFKISESPGSENIDKPGFYYNDDSCRIEHWSEECDYNKIMAFDEKNGNGLIKDGFQSIIGFENLDGLIKTIEVWDAHLKKYGVK